MNLVYFSTSGTSAKKFANYIIYSISKYFVPTEDVHSVHIPLRSHRTLDLCGHSLHRALDFHHYSYYSQPLAKARTKQQNLVCKLYIDSKSCHSEVFTLKKSNYIKCSTQSRAQQLNSFLLSWSCSVVPHWCSRHSQ